VFLHGEFLLRHTHIRKPPSIRFIPNEPPGRRFVQDLGNTFETSTGSSTRRQRREFYDQIDLVVHCGTRIVGSFVHSLVLTDIASGWTECVALPVREQALIVEVINGLRPRRLPFPLMGLDTDNDSASMNDTPWDYCQEQGRTNP
jgi:hypothetical protein